MASAFTHAVAALGIATAYYKREIPKSVWIAGAVCSTIPDLDTIGFGYGIRYEDFWGHRGFTHSLVFAALLAIVVAYPAGSAVISRWKLWSYLFLATASHGLLDAMTDGGLGVAFFSPFENSRYFLPWRPIVVAPISIRRFFTGRGVEVMKSELLWVWLPVVVVGSLVLVVRRRKVWVVSDPTTLTPKAG